MKNINFGKYIDLNPLEKYEPKHLNTISYRYININRLKKELKIKMKKKTNCGDCRHQVSGFDGGFFGLPTTCECSIFGETENRKSCKRFKRRFPTGFDLLVEFQKWYNLQDEKQIEYEDLLKFRREWK